MENGWWKMASGKWSPIRWACFVIQLGDMTIETSRRGRRKSERELSPVRNQMTIQNQRKSSSQTLLTNSPPFSTVKRGFRGTSRPPQAAIAAGLSWFRDSTKMLNIFPGLMCALGSYESALLNDITIESAVSFVWSYVLIFI